MMWFLTRDTEKGNSRLTRPSGNSELGRGVPARKCEDVVTFDLGFFFFCKMFLMWTIFKKVFTGFVTVVLLFYVLFFWP